MGAKWSQQGCLKLTKDAKKIETEEGKFYTFEKTGHRLYMLNVPMDLFSRDLKALGKIIITEFTVGNDKTKGKYKVIKKYSDEESKIISKNFIPYQNFQ